MLRSIMVTLGVSVVTCWFVFLAHGWFHATLLPILGISDALGHAISTMLAMLAALVGQLVVSRTLFNDEMFGKQRVIDSFRKGGNTATDGNASADDVAKNVLWDLRRFVGLAKATDDVTLVTAKVR